MQSLETSLSSQALFAMEVVTDCLFSVDIVLRFFLAYEHSQTGEAVTDRRKIATHYFMSRMFVVDVVSVLPLSYIDLLASGAGTDDAQALLATAAHANASAAHAYGGAGVGKSMHIIGRTARWIRYFRFMRMLRMLRTRRLLDRIGEASEARPRHFYVLGSPHVTLDRVAAGPHFRTMITTCHPRPSRGWP